MTYWLLIALLTVAGLLTIFTIGLAFLLMAIALVVLNPFRSQPQVFWSGLVLVVGFLVGYILVAPAGCVATAVPVEEAATTGPVLCRSLGGITYQGPEGYSPSLRPGLLAGVAAGVFAALMTWIAIGRRAPLSSPNDPDGVS